MRKKKRNWMFTKEDDLFILERAYTTATFKAIENLLNFPRDFVLGRIQKMFVGSPVCPDHSNFHRKCEQCQSNLIEWRKKNKIKIKQMEYSTKHPIDKRRRKKIEEMTSHCTKLIPREIYDEILDIILVPALFHKNELNLIVKHVQWACLNTFLEEYNYDLSIPIVEIDLYFQFQPNQSFMDIIQLWIPQFNSKREHIPQYLKRSLQDILYFKNIYSESENIKIFHVLYEFNKSTQSIVDFTTSFCGALFFLYGKRHKKITYIDGFSKFFHIDEKTLIIQVEQLKYLCSSALETFQTHLDSILYDKFYQLLEKIEGGSWEIDPIIHFARKNTCSFCKGSKFVKSCELREKFGCPLEKDF